MLIIWKNFISRVDNNSLAGICMLALASIAVSLTYDPWWFYGSLVTFLWLVFFPAAIYLVTYRIDRDAKQNPGRPKTLRRLGRILIGR
ncbi:hypothetical protein MYX06_04665 [Patescibacteria group bacterium AH-259-L05]|nr:hypothetical protein [Patescibacteria group bacterium AH-259-L05]